MVATCGAPGAGSPAPARGRAQLAGSDREGGQAGAEGGASARGLTLWRPRAPAAVRGRRWGGGKQTLSSSPTWVLPGAARVCVADGEGGTRGLCNAGSHVCSLPGCAAEQGPGLRSRAASRGWARCGPGRASRAPGRPGKGLRREGVSRGLVLRLAPARPRAGTVGRGVGFWPRKGGLEAPSGDRGLRAGAAWRARSGGGARPGRGGGATAAPRQAKFEKRTRFPPFFKPKNKTFCPHFSPFPFALRAFFTPGLQGRALVGPGQPL